MGISNTKRSLSGGSPVKREGGKSGKAVPSPKETKKDTSIFAGIDYLEGGRLGFRLKSPRFYQATKLSGQDRVRLGGELSKAYGGKLNPEKLKDAGKQVDLGQWGKFKHLSLEDRKRMQRLIKGISGK